MPRLHVLIATAAAPPRRDACMWLFVVGHHPAVSSGLHAGSALLVARLQPLLEACGAAYLCGHDHDLEHLQLRGVHHLVSGGGSELRPLGRRRPGAHDLSSVAAARAAAYARVAESTFAASANGALLLRLTSYEAVFEFFDASGGALHKFTVASRARL